MNDPSNQPSKKVHDIQPFPTETYGHRGPLPLKAIVPKLEIQEKLTKM